MQNKTEIEKIGLVLASVGIHKGVNWGLLRESTKGYEIMERHLKEGEHKQIKVVEVKNGIVVEVGDDYLLNSIEKLEDRAVTKEVRETVWARKTTEERKFMAYLTKVLKGDISGVDFEEFHISVYSIKDQMRLNGIDYPTFKMKPDEVIGIFKKLSRELQDRVFIKLTDTEFIPIREIKNKQEVEKGLSIASTGTGVFMTFRVMGV